MVIRQNSTFGEEVLYRLENTARWGHTAITLTECVLLMIEKDSLVDAVDRFGDPFMRVRMKVTSAILRVTRVTRRAAMVALGHCNFAEG